MIVTNWKKSLLSFRTAHSKQYNWLQQATKLHTWFLEDTLELKQKNPDEVITFKGIIQYGSKTLTHCQNKINIPRDKLYGGANSKQCPLQK